MKLASSEWLMNIRLLLAGFLICSLLACGSGNGGDGIIAVGFADSGDDSGSSSSSSSSSGSSSSGSSSSSSSSTTGSTSSSSNGSGSSSSSSSGSSSSGSGSSSSSSSSSGGDGLRLPITPDSLATPARADGVGDSVIAQGLSLGGAGYQEMLEDLVTSAAACAAAPLLFADMHSPPLYSRVNGICIRIDPAGPEQANYFSDEACTRRLAFRPDSYQGYCREMLAVGPNKRLGNAASWTPDTGQPNDPARATPSRKWTVPYGSRLGISSEDLDGKSAPFMKRLRYREVVTSYNVRPLYWSCVTRSGPCKPGTRPDRNAVLLGYIKRTAEPGTAPLYWSCVSNTLMQNCVHGMLTTQPGVPGSSLLGYIPSKSRPGTRPLYWGCANRPRPAVCIHTRNRRAAAGESVRLGYVYDKKFVKGTCALEMRVYKKDANATGLTPLLAFHGGGWRYRGGAFVGFEAQLAHYTEDGFVVFVPFYRLAGEDDGNSDCNGAPWSAITADAEAALDWVGRHGVAFGAQRVPPAVMGQSAGAHLAGWLLTHRPREVSAGLLLYGPSDMYDFLAQAVPQGGLYHGRYRSSLRILDVFYGSSVRTIDLGADDDFVRLNSYHNYVRAGGVPPVFLIHGKADAIVPSNQSVLMCNAYGGNAEDAGGAAQRRASYVCGSNGRLHLFQQGEHGLDGCLRNGTVDACAAGDEASRRLLVNSLKEARAWLRNQADAAGR